MGEILIGRTQALLRVANVKIALQLLDHVPDHAGLIGAIHLLPSWILSGHSAILAVDSGSTNIRGGIVELKRKNQDGVASAKLSFSKIYKHGDQDFDRDDAVERVVDILRSSIKNAEIKELMLAPVIDVGCPGIINEDGSINRGAQNLPGTWDSAKFNFPLSSRDAIPKVRNEATLVVMHNDAVVQGLSELPLMQHFNQMAVLNIGIGLGNASFANKRD